MRRQLSWLLACFTPSPSPESSWNDFYVVDDNYLGRPYEGFLQKNANEVKSDADQYGTLRPLV